MSYFPEIDEQLVAWRMNTLLTKEPETIEWITRMRKNAVFYDVGANIGVYSVFAAQDNPKRTVVAIEPQIDNFLVLMSTLYKENIKNILPIYAGASVLSEVAGFAPSDDPRPGSSGGKIILDKNKGTICWSVCLDNLIYNMGLPVPNHIKIDVDNGTMDILSGMVGIVRRPEFASMLIEAEDKEQSYQIMSWAYSRGLGLDEELMEHTNHSNKRRKADPNNNTRNLIFRRN